MSLTNEQLAFAGTSERGEAVCLEIPVADVDFTFLNGAGHLVVSAGPLASTSLR